MVKLQIEDIDREGADKIEIRSEAMRNVLEQVPRWIVRYGTAIIVLIILLLVSGTALLKYPDVIGARIVLTTEVPPADLTANTSARIDSLTVDDGQLVHKGEVLCILESAASFKDVHRLDSMLSTSFSYGELLNQDYFSNLHLGTVQTSYAAFQKRVKEYESFVKLDYHGRKIKSVKEELYKYKELLISLQDQEKIIGKEYNLALKQYRRDSILFIDGVISSSYLEKSESDMLGKLFEIKEVKTNIASARIEISDLEQEILELELKLEENSKLMLQQLREAYENVRGQVLLWQDKYVIRSPFDGHVSYTEIWSENQYVKQGDIVLTVIPVKQGEIVGRIELSSQGAGKISKGQQVIIRFDNYPYLEYGTVEGKVNTISLVPNNDIYSVEVRFDHKELTTNYGIQLEFKQNMPGLAEIVTEKRSLFARVFSPFKSAMHRQRSLNK